MVGTRGVYVCWIWVCWWDGRKERKGVMQLFEEQQREEEFKNVVQGLGYAVWLFRSCSWREVVLSFSETRFSRVWKGGGGRCCRRSWWLGFGLGRWKWYRHRPDGSEECTIASATWDAPAGMRGTPQ